jgi:hypothetical protein
MQNEMPEVINVTVDRAVRMKLLAVLPGLSTGAVVRLAMARLLATETKAAADA